EPSASRLRDAHRGSRKGRAPHARVHRDESQQEDAGARGRWLRPLGVERDPLLPRHEEAAERRLAIARPAAGRRAALARVGERVLGRRVVRHGRIREGVQGGAPAGSAGPRLHRARRGELSPLRGRARRRPSRAEVADRQRGDDRGLRDRRVGAGRAAAGAPGREVPGDRTLVRRARVAPGMARVASAAVKPWIWLRIAAGLQAFGTVGHTVATASTVPTHGPGEQAVLDAMRGFHFDIMGSTRSIWDFYRGYQLSTTVTFVLLVVVLWLLGNLSRGAPQHARPLVLAIFIAQIGTVIVGWTYFFAAPGVVGSAIALCLAIAGLT